MNHGITLLLACEKGDYDLAKKLFAYRESRLAIFNFFSPLQISSQRPNGETLLMYAIKSGNIKLIKLLINKGAKVNVINKWGQTALQIAAKKGDTEIGRLLLEEGADVNAVRKKAWSALTNAADGGHIDFVKLLLKHEADVNYAYKDGGWTPLMAAASSGDTDILELLLDAGANIDADHGDGTALKYAANCSNKEAVAFLISKGVKVDEEDWELKRKLRDLSYTTAEETVSQSERSTTDETQFDGTFISAPEDIFKAHEDVGLVKEYLIDNASKAKDEGVYSVWSWIDSRSGTTYYQFIRNVSESNDFEFDSPSYVTEETMLYEAGHFRASGREVVDGPNWHERDELKKQKLEGGNLEKQLYAAIEDGNEGSFNKLIEQGADTNAVIDGDTPLMWAAEADNLEMVKQLIKAGGDINYKDTEGFPLIARVAHKSGKNIMPILNALIDAGADTQATNAHGHSAIELIKYHIPEFEIMNKPPVKNGNDYCATPSAKGDESGFIKALDVSSIDDELYTGDELKIIYCMGTMYGSTIGSKRMEGYIAFVKNTIKKYKGKIKFYSTCDHANCGFYVKNGIVNFPRLLFFSKGELVFNYPEPHLEKPIETMIDVDQFIGQPDSQKNKV